ncbi:amidohydrolase family protein [Octadecabacter sp.]|jgi:predicted TIM-barrel fold metal-dependent hydrolase|nr:amidohydrolase family protein [Octadecabacter sp.]
MRVIAIEEHFWSGEFAAHFSGPKADRSPDLMRRLEDYAELRIADLDAAGIDVQVISHAPPGGQRLNPDTAIQACRDVNDALAAIIRGAPDRFAGFATLPQVHPEAAADELQRCVEELGFQGAMMFGITNGKMLDEEEFWPIYARAEELRVPVYLHPSMPHPEVRDIYYGTYSQSHPALIGAAWGFGIETGTLGIRMVLSGVFKAHPNLQVILGHLGEGITFQLARIDEALSRPGNEPSDFAATFRNNFHITTSGFFSDSALRCCIEEMGEDRILFAVDWPFVSNADGTNWLRAFPTDATTRAKIFSGNAERLLSL